MTPIKIAIFAFIVLETLNVIVLYFKPSSKLGNGVGVFNAYEKSKENPEVHALVKYLINWVAGVKLIFIALLIVILYKADAETQYLTVIALVLSVATYFWRLGPMIKKMDENGEITPKGYSKGLSIMILSIVVIFIAVLFMSAPN